MSNRSLLLILSLIILVLVLAGCGSETPPPVPAANCSDSAQNQNETSTDCGGPCSPCENGKSCLTSKDCLSSNCIGSLCKAIESCTDKIKNQDESDTDCGGKCSPCTKGKKCSLDKDCDGVSCLSGICNTPPVASCTDGLKNQDESGADCGGSKCGKCSLGGSCLSDTDCGEGSCIEGSCQVPSGDCSNRKLDGSETDIDCGGSCPKKCVNGRYCSSNADRASNLCVDNKFGAGVSCKDKVLNQDESDTDCGGKCPKCILGKDCKENSDCQSDYCSAEKCQTMPPADCTNRMKDRDETDVDCGGTKCSSCAANRTCRIGVDCQSSTCSNGICLP